MTLTSGDLSVENRTSY